MELANLPAYKTKHGFEALESYLKRIADIFKSICNNSDYSTYRLSDSAFALLATNVEKQTSQGIAQQISEAMQELHANISDNNITCHIGVALYHKGLSSQELLSAADMAYQSAQGQANFSWHCYEPEAAETTEIKSATEWHHYLNQIIVDGNIILHFQPTFEKTETGMEVHHHEVFLRIPDGMGSLLNAGLFIPIAENLNLMSQFDKLVIEKVLLQAQQNDQSKMRFAVNLSPNSLMSTDFVQYLKSALQAKPAIAQRLILEIPEQSLSFDHARLSDVIQSLQALGCQFSLDHFGRGLTSVKYLQTLKVDYLKLDGSYTRHVNDEQANQFFIHVITELAHNFDIKVFAENVENDSQLEKLRDLNVDGYQGYLLGKPSANFN